jgi:tetratricopeptide (TPR) repeat protein
MRVEAGRKRLGFIVKFYEIWYSKEDLEEQLNKIISDLETVLTFEEPAIQAYMDKVWYIAEALGKPEISARVEADLSYFKGDYEGSVKSLLKYLNVHKHDEKAWYNLGIAYGRLQRHKDAISANKKALEINPDKHEAWYNLGYTYGCLQKHEDSINAYKKALEIKPDMHEAWYNLGNTHGRLKRYEDAISAYKKALEIKPDMHEAWYNLGNTHGRLKRYEDAISAYKKALEIKPDEHEAWNNLGIIYGRLQRYEDVISAYKRAVEIKPDKNEAWYNLGATYVNLEKYDEAIEAYVKAMEINPEDHDTWQNLCTVHLISFGKDTLAKRGNFDSTKLRQALECLPHIKEKKEIYELFGTISRFLLEEKKIDGIKGILTEVERTGHEDLLEFLTPYSTLVKYIDTKDRQIIDRLRSEERIIVEEMLQTL